MDRKAQFSGRFVVWFIALFALIVIAFFGYRAISQSTETGCLAQSTLFKKNFISDIEEMYVFIGSVVEKSYAVPCGIERIYFVDTDKDVSFSSLGRYPEIIDNLESKTGKNVFLIKDGRVYDSFYGGDLEIANPYYDCYLTGRGLLTLFLEGEKGRTGILKKGSVFDCTFEVPNPVELSTEDLRELLREINETFEPKEDCNITRTITVEGGETIVSVKNCDEENIFYERIPKCALEILTDLGIINLSEYEAVIVKSDPLIVWYFGADEGMIYKIDKMIEEKCKRKFEGLAFEKEDIELATSFGTYNLAALSSSFGADVEGQALFDQKVRYNIQEYFNEGDGDYLESAIEGIDLLLAREITPDKPTLEGLKNKLELELST